ncbi:MAG: radical SAM protein [Myxococcales bacterium]|nr:radical SAM protein [Myxococcales bacterium]
MMHASETTTAVRTPRTAARTRLPVWAPAASQPKEPTAPAARSASSSAAARPRPEPLRLVRYRPRPGHADVARLADEARALADALAPGLEAPESGRALFARRARSSLTAAQNYVHNRALARRGREDFRPLTFIWTLLRSCNFSCSYCDDHRGHKYPDLPNDGVLDTAQGLELLRIMRTRTPSLYFAGGEPLMRRDLPRLTRAARDLAFHPIIVNTNASAVDRVLRLPAWKSWLADTDIVVVSLDGLDLANLRELYAYRRPEEVVRNLLLLRELAPSQHVKLMVNCVIQPGRLEDARDVLDLCADLGVWFCPVPMNVGPRMHDALRADPAYQALAALILARKREGQLVTGSLRLLERLLGGAPLDCRNTLKPHVDFDGRLYWPCKACVNVEPERIRVLDFPDVDSLYAHACRVVSPTGFHGPAKNQCGAACNWAQNYTTDAYAHGLTHTGAILAEVVEFLRGGR